MLAWVAAEWTALGPIRQRAYSQRSQVSTKRRKSTQPDAVAEFVRAAAVPSLESDTFWGIGDERFPLGEAALHQRMLPHDVRGPGAGSQQSFVASQQRQWRDFCGCCVEPARVMPEKVTVDTPCSEISSLSAWAVWTHRPWL